MRLLSLDSNRQKGIIEMEKKAEKKKEIKQKYMGNQREPFSIMTIPILLVLALLPVITRMVTLDSHVEELLFGVDTDTNYDAFLYAKGIILLVLAGVMLAVLVGTWFFDREWPRLGLAFIPLAVYALFVIISSVRSDYQEFAMKGVDDSYQSMFILLAYCVLVVYSYVMVRSETAVKRIFTWWTIGIFLLVFIGISQMFFKDFWSTWLGKHLLLAVKDWKMNLTFKFEPGRVYMSQYNPNYVGGLAVMIILPFGILALLRKEKVRWVYALAAVGMLLCLLGSQSKNGIIALVLTAALMPVFFRKKLKRYWLVTVITGVVLIGSIVGMDFARGHFISNALKTTWNTLTKHTESVQDEKAKLEDIQTTDEDVVVYYDGNELHVRCAYNSADSTMVFAISDQNGKEIAYKDEVGFGIYEFEDERFDNISLRTGMQGEVACFGLNIGGIWWNFSNEIGRGGYYYYSATGYFTRMVKAESVVFTNMGKLGSGRGYIWARSIPLLKDTILIGRGADNFWAYFPRFDYVEAWKNGYYGKTVGMPHNMYLQIGVNSGVLSLIAFLAFFIIYFVDCIKLYWKDEFDHFLPQAGIGICLATFAYMLTGLLNDMMVCVAPVFWCLMGLGLAVNRLYRKEKEN